MNPRTIRAIQDAMKRVSEACDAQFIVTTHKPKNEIAEFSGSGSIRNSSDAMLVAGSLKGGPGAVSIRATKMRGALHGTQLHCRVVRRFYTNAHGQEVSYGSVIWDRVVPPKEPGARSIEADDNASERQAPKPTRAAAPNQAQATFLASLSQALTRTPVSHTDATGQPITVARLADVRAIFNTAYAGRPGGTIRTAWKDALDTLTAAGTVARIDTDAGPVLHRPGAA